MTPVIPDKSAEETLVVGSIGMMDAIRILKQCRAATADIVRPTRKREVDSYIAACVPIVAGIVIEAMKDDLPE